MGDSLTLNPFPGFVMPPSILQSPWKGDLFKRSYRSCRCHHSKCVPMCKGDMDSENTFSQDAAMRGYLEKVKKRLYKSKNPPELSKKDDTSGELLGDLDIVDDIVMGRGPSNTGQVRVFGAWLDENVAGRKAADGKDSEPDNAMHSGSLKDKGKSLFDEGMICFVRGAYPKAAASFQRAVVYAGINSREGGEYQLWLAQSWDAAGDKAKALAALSALSTHMDGDVRKVMEELKFIMSAPRLKCKRSWFMEIPEFKETAPSYTKYVLGYGLNPKGKIKHGPEKYSLEWYMRKSVPPKDNATFASDWVVVIGVLTAFAAFLASAFSGTHIVVPAF